MVRSTSFVLLALVAALSGCDGPEELPAGASSDGADAVVAPSSASAAPGAAPGSASPSATLASPREVRETQETQEQRLERFVAMVDGLSEPDAEFFSDNLVSNETSFLHVADELPALAPRGQAYVGVGPEQNFSYLALLEPSLAVVVDIRRDNLRLHLLYKAAFEASSSRPHFVALLLGRPTPKGGVEAGAPVAEVLTGATREPATEDSFAAAHAELRGRIATWGLRLSPTDWQRTKAIHRSLFDGQLELRFALKEANGRTYPTLGEMLSATDREGRARGFLASEEAFRKVQQMQREHRVIPVVGDFAGDKAMPGVAAALAKSGAKVGTFYVSNVEQYLFDPGVWTKWRRNVAALPRAEGAVFVRAWLDQGRSHPKQVKGHRTATLVASMDRFESAQRERPYGTWWTAANDGILEVAPAGKEAGE